MFDEETAFWAETAAYLYCLLQVDNDAERGKSITIQAEVMADIIAYSG